MVISLLAFALMVYLFFRRDYSLLSLGFVFLSFGTLAIIPPELLRGTTILASALTFLALAGQQVLRAGGTSHMISGLFMPGNLGILFLYTALAVIGAFVLPRAFQGEILVYPLNTSGLISITEPLQPTSSNINQALNQIMAFSVAVAVFAMARRVGFVDGVRTAALFGAGAIVVTGVADLITAQIGLQSLLDPFRTASYVLMAGSEVNGVRRVIGLMSEASSYGAVAASVGGFLFFIRYSFDPKARLRRVYPLSALCILMALLSTSSTAYAAVAVIAALHLCDVAWRMMFGLRANSGPLFYEIIVSVALLLVGLSVFVAWSDAQKMVMDLLDSIIFNKKQTFSYLERKAWTDQAYQAFLDSKGVGVGLGGVRTSNFFVNILACTGVMGVGLLALFVLRVMLARVDRTRPEEFELVHGAKLTIFISATSAALAGTTPDYGPFVATLFGICVGLATRPAVLLSDSPRETPPTELTSDLHEVKA